MMIPLGTVLQQSKAIVEGGLTPQSTSELLKLFDVAFSESLLQNARIYSDTLPVGAHIHPYSEEQRLLHFVWDVFDKTPYSLLVELSIPLRRILAGKLFNHCGRNFLCESGVSFNYGHQISVGDDVFFNRGVFIDSKGGVTIGDSVCLTENVTIFTHGHSESDHRERVYSPVTIERYAKIYSGAIILPGVTIGEQGIVTGGSIVTKDVVSNSVVAGVPAKVIRERTSDGGSGEALNHIWLDDGIFQDEPPSTPPVLS